MNTTTSSHRAAPRGDAPATSPHRRGRLLAAYLDELRHLREGGAEFAREFPQVAAQLGLHGADGDEACADPHVERLLEGVAWLTGRVRQEIEAGHPRLAAHLLDRWLPFQTAPTPSMAILQFELSPDDPALAAGPVVAARRLVSTGRGPGRAAACRFRTGHAVRLWPLAITAARWRSHADTSTLELQFRTTGGQPVGPLSLEDLVLHLPGDPGRAHALHAALVAHAVEVEVLPEDTVGGGVCVARGVGCVTPVGLAAHEALLPATDPVVEGFRLLAEYAALPERFLFCRLPSLAAGVRRCPGTSFTVRLHLDRAEPSLDGRVEAGAFALHAVPVVNLFPMRADRIDWPPVGDSARIVPDRSRPGEHEAWTATRVTGFDRGGVLAMREFLPLQARGDDRAGVPCAGYVTRRLPRAEAGPAPLGAPPAAPTELHLSLSDPSDPPWPEAMAQVAVELLCLDGDAPASLPAGDAADWYLEQDAPVRRVRCLKRPTRRLEPVPEGASAWTLVAHAGSGLRSLLEPSLRTDAAGSVGRTGLHELLAALAHDPRSALRPALAAIVGMHSRACMRRMPVAGPPVVARGRAVRIDIDERPLAAGGGFVLGQVLATLLASRAGWNTFVELTLVSSTTGDVLGHWPPCFGEATAP